VKGQLYTEARIRDYWIVDVPGDAIEIYREPGAGRFQLTQRLGRGTVLTPLAFPDVTLTVADILG